MLPAGVLICLLTACQSESPAPGPGPAPPAPPPFSVPPGLSPALTSMLQGLPAYLTQALQANQDLLPRNPQSTSYIQAKIGMLQDPALANAIVAASRWVEGQVMSANGRAVPIVCVFPAEAMRAEAVAAARTLEGVLPILESFFDTPFTTAVVRVWYGFVIGNSGGGGVIYTEDRATYESRTPATRLPYDAILGHELGHSYVGNESLNQFLEMYAYNVIRTGSTDPAQWTFTRNWVAGLATNQDSAAVMDIYQLVGHDVLRQSYRAIRPLFPAYGQPLSQAVIQAFVAPVPEPQKAQVSAKLARVMF